MWKEVVRTRKKESCQSPCRVVTTVTHDSPDQEVKPILRSDEEKELHGVTSPRGTEEAAY